MHSPSARYTSEPSSHRMDPEPCHVLPVNAPQNISYLHLSCASLLITSPLIRIRFGPTHAEYTSNVVNVSDAYLCQDLFTYQDLETYRGDLAANLSNLRIATINLADRNSNLSNVNERAP